MLASTLVISLGSLAAGCATADEPQLAAQPAPPPADVPKGVQNVSLVNPGTTIRARMAVMRRDELDSPRAACLDATRQAEQAHRIPEGLMVAIALAESGLHGYAMNIGGRPYYPDSMEEARRIYRNAGRGQYLMAGCVQVNARVHARNSDWPLDPWQAADWGASYLRQHYETYGNWVDAIRRWNGAMPSGNALACRVQAKLQVTNPNSKVLDGVSCGNTAIARERRNGAALLEIAEAGAE
ncbi:transglycosylase SLT domain-containing protein [Roseomonas xinghualingensis]|uniref:transglycosylase SLT domain-containing protein n=1 Tax=Roseomonas xinghualingensis TaxID=2986475 RepID=UPI0021F0BC08|nr:transglycosylase SLT domain-containing protein [Roseomonas sp. SXEYE001]MCV4207002.1 transglycosylase SLT domain-containing protein [Roseomonas sp. SXEYE001]